MPGILTAIYTTSSRGAPMQAQLSVQAIAGIGLEGDRYAAKNGTLSKQSAAEPNHVTLIESEAIEAARRDYELTFDAGMTRRNLLVTGVPLNHLVGKTFRIGDVVIQGVELCEPCGHLERLTCTGIKKALIHRGGLRAVILSGGTLTPGDRVEW